MNVTCDGTHDSMVRDSCKTRTWQTKNEDVEDARIRECMLRFIIKTKIKQSLVINSMESTDHKEASLIPSQASSGVGRRRRNRGRKKQHAKDNDGAGGTTETKTATNKPHPQQATTNDAAPKKKQPRKRRNDNAGKRNQQRKKFPWRRHIPKGSLDPITLESLVSLPYPPFALAATEPYTPVKVWPEPEETATPESEEKQKHEKVTAEEWERRVIEQQWGQQAAVLPLAAEKVESKEEEENVPVKKRHYNLFDGRALAYYLVSQLQFIDPFNRRDLTREEIVNLEDYLVRHGFTDLNVLEAYDAKGVTLSKAGSRGSTDEGRAAILQQEAQALLNNLFIGSNQLQRQYAASQRQPRSSANSNRARRQETEDTGIYGTDDGAFLVIDDDENPGLRGQRVRDAPNTEGPIPAEISMAPNTLWTSNRITQNLNYLARSRAHNFPALPTTTTTTSGSSTSKEAQQSKGPSKSLQKITKVVVPTDPAQRKRQKEAREEAQRRAMMANLNFFAPGTQIYDNPETSSDGLLHVPSRTDVGPTSGQILRNQAMASALGVVPATVRHQQINSGWRRPTRELELDEFGNELNAAQYPDSLIEEARERMDQLLKLERRWKNFLADDRSATLPLKPMDKPLRTFVHHYSDFWHLHTESFDREPKRYINCVKLRDTCVPVPLLSDVAQKWRGPAPVVLPRAPRENTIEQKEPKQEAGQTTSSREFPPAPQREPLRLKPRTVQEDGQEKPREREFEVLEENPSSLPDGDTQLNNRFDSLFTGRERPKLQLAARTLPPELPPYQQPKKYDVAAERERQQAEMAEKARKEREEAERKAKILAYAFASSDEESLASAGGSSDWEEAEEQYSGSDSEESS